MSKLVVWARPYRGDPERLAPPAQARVLPLSRDGIMILGGHVRSVLRSVAVGVAVMVWAGTASGQSPAMSCWGVPDGARPVGAPEERRFEVPESLPGPPPANAEQPDRRSGAPHPPLIAAEQPFAGELWVPAADESELPTYINRSLPYRQLVTTPLGSFDLAVASLRAVRQGGRDSLVLHLLQGLPGIAQPPEVSPSAR